MRIHFDNLFWIFSQHEGRDLYRFSCLCIRRSLWQSFFHVHFRHANHEYVLSTQGYVVFVIHGLDLQSKWFLVEFENHLVLFLLCSFDLVWNKLLLLRSFIIFIKLVLEIYKFIRHLIFQTEKNWNMEIIVIMDC